MGEEKVMIKTAGALFFLSGALIWMGIVTAEIFYPSGYSIASSMISTLGASPPPNSLVFEPSANIFDYSLLFAGILIISGSYLIRKIRGIPLLIWSLMLMGFGVLGVGIFPAFHKYIHPLVALAAFLFGGVAAVLSARAMPSPFRYLSLGLGLTTLLFLGLGIFADSLVVPILGNGGTERWVAYPIMIWLIGFGGVLMGLGNSFNSKS